MKINHAIGHPLSRNIALVLGIAFATLSTGVCAEQIRVILTGGMEVPPVETQAHGSGTITINPDMTISGSVATSGVAATMAHVHQAPVGKNGGVIVTLAKSGDAKWAIPDGTRLTEAQYQAYKAGELYINVHSDENKGGEIRGQLRP